MGVDVGALAHHDRLRSGRAWPVLLAWLDGAPADDVVDLFTCPPSGRSISTTTDHGDRPER